MPRHRPPRATTPIASARSCRSNQFTGWAYADSDGKSASDAARELLVQMCEYSLHLDDFESALPEGSA